MQDTADYKQLQDLYLLKKELEENLKNDHDQMYPMSTSKSDARNIVTVFIGLFGFFALLSAFQAYQTTHQISDVGVISGSVIGILAFVIAYKLLQ